ncbi:MAG: prolyl oligopeptidase family serine peptidase [Gemmatimonadaceae bacterium]|nr:prolyl oligopeptidase family serine peptidase [Gemmatimonadaceae bacterium]
MTFSSRPRARRAPHALTGPLARSFVRRLLPLAAVITVSTVVPARSVVAQAALTSADLLDVRSVSVGDYSPDGRWVLVRVSRRGDGLGFVAARDGDPSYTRPAPARLLLMNSATGDTSAIVTVPRTLGAIAWSPRGDRLAIATRDTVPQLLMWEVATKRLRVVSTGGARLAENTTLSWTSDDRLLLAIRERGWREEVRARFDSLVAGPISVQVGTEPFLAWDVLRRMGNRALVVSLTPSTGKMDTLVAPTQLSSWTASRDGQWISWREDRNAKTNYDGGPTNESRMFARRLRDSARVVFPSLRGVTVQMADDGERYAFARDGVIYVASLADSTPRRVIGTPVTRARDSSSANAAAASTREERFTLVRIAPNGEQLVVSSRAGLSLVSAADGSRRVLHAVTDTLTAPRVTVADWSADGRTIMLARSERTTWDRALVRYTVATGTVDTLVRDGRIYGAPSLSPDGSRLVLTIGAQGRPADLWLADGRFSSPRMVLASNPQLANKPLPVTQLVSYLDADGRRQYGVLTLPTANARALPTVFSVYEEFFDDGFDATTSFLANQGYAVMKPSVTFETGYPGEAWLKGVTASANKLIEMGIADSARLGVHGTSYGGYATNLLITQTNRFKAAINVSGKVDIISFYTDSPRLGVRNVNAAEKTQDRIGATLWEQPQKYVQHSAVMFADRIKTPLLLMTGGEDHNVPAINTREMYFALRRLGKPVEWVNYTNGGHGIPMTNATEFGDWHTRLLGWYDRYLKPKTGANATSQ